MNASLANAGDEAGAARSEIVRAKETVGTIRMRIKL
jgi:hypothetical protein